MTTQPSDMELNALKDIWKNHSHAREEAHRQSKEALQQLLRQRSRTALGRINRNIRLEAALVVVLALMLAGWRWQAQSPFLLAESIVITLYALLSLLYYRYKYRLLNRVAIGDHGLRSALTHVARSMRRFMGYYASFHTLGVPLLAAGGMLYGFYLASSEDGISLSEVDLRVWLIFGIALAIYIPLAMWFFRWYVRRLYGRYYDELRVCREELESLE